MNSNYDFIIGMEFFSALGVSFMITSVTPTRTIQPDLDDDSHLNLLESYPELHEAIQQKKALNSPFCTIPNSDVAIETGNHQPIYIMQRSIPYAYREFVKSTIDTWLAQGVIKLATKHNKWIFQFWW